MSGAKLVRRRLFKWTEPGYEDSYDQYAIFDEGSVWITQIAFKDNMGLAMQSGWPHWQQCETVEKAESWVQHIMDGRMEHGEEVVTPMDDRKCPLCEHPKWAHGPERPGCVSKGCGCKLEYEGTNGDEDEEG